MSLCPASDALDVEIVLDIDVIRRAVASTRPAAK